MRQPVNPSFERMRLEAERQRLAELEVQAETLAARLEEQTDAARRDRDALETQNRDLKQALDAQGQSGKSKTAELEARCAALDAELAARTAAAAEQKAELEALRQLLDVQVEAERATAAALEARCAALGDELEAQAQIDADAHAKLDELRTALSAEAGGAREKAAALAAQIESIDSRVTRVDESFSEPERLRSAIAPVLSGALRDAGQGGHDPMASAIAPYVVGTIRKEILNSEDELVEAIHPRLGVLITAAIAGAIEDLNRKVDEAVPIDRWMASIKGRLTGAPSAGFLLDSGETFMLKEAMLIERQSGVLLARELTEAAGDDGPDEDLMAGMIAALQGFAAEAYTATGAGDLRRVSLTTDTVYLRASPSKILAVRCSGVAPLEIERKIDALLVTALERLRDEDADPGKVLMLDDFNMPAAVEDDGVNASTIMGRGLGAIAATVACVWGSGAVQEAHEARWLASVEQAIAGDDRLGPFPLSAVQSPVDGSVRISGLLPDDAALDTLKQRLDWSAVPVPVTLDVALVSDTNR